MPERCVHTQTAGRGRRRLTPGGGDTHTAPSAILLLYTPHPLPAHGCPPTPTLQTPGNQTANAAPMRGSGPRWSFNVKGETYPTQTRGPWDTSSRNTQARHQAHRRPRPPPQTEPPPPARPPPQQSGTVTCSSSRRTRAGAHPAPVRVTRHREPSFSEPVNLTPAPPGGSIPQAQFHRGDRNNNIYILKLTESPPWGMSKAATAMDPSIRFPPLLPSPAPPAARGLTGDRGRVCSLSRRQTSSNPRGPTRTHLNTAAATDTINHQRREGRRGDTLSRSLL